MKVHCHVHEYMSLVSILSQMQPMHTFAPSFPEILSNIVFTFIPTSSEWSLQVLQPKYYMHFHLSHACYMPCSFHPPWFDHPNNIFYENQEVADRYTALRFHWMLSVIYFTTVSTTALGPTQPPIQWAPGALSLGVRRPVREADHSPPSSVEAKNAWSCTSTLSQYVFMAWCLVKHRDNFTLRI
jgi:hypothetical protein